MHPLRIYADSPPFPMATPHTRRTYRTQWRLFREWTLRQGKACLPASPDTVARYLVDRGSRGLSISTIRVSATAIAAVHRWWNFQSPTRTRTVRRTLKQLAHMDKRPSVSTQPLTDSALNVIQSVAPKPRIGRGGFREKRSTARRRGRQDIALIRLMRDASLGRSETATLVWGDVTSLPKGRGLIRVRRARAGNSYERIAVSRDTMRAVRAIRPKAATPASPVFGLSESQIHRRIRAAASAAGIGSAFGGNSGRAAGRRTRKNRPSRDVSTPALEAWANDVLRTGRFVPPVDKVERGTRSSEPPSGPGESGAGPQADTGATPIEGPIPQRPKYPNGSPEQ